MANSDDSKPSPSPPQYLEVTCGISGKTRRFAAGTDAGFAVALINRNLKGPIQVATHIEAVKDGEEPIAFGSNAILSNFGEGWKLQTVTITQSIPSEEVKRRHVRGSPELVSSMPRGERPLVSTPLSSVYIVKILFAFLLIFVLGAIFTLFLDNLPALILFVKSMV